MSTERSVSEKIEYKVPRSVAIIMDGNGRWATERGLSRSAGHSAGARNLSRVLSVLCEMGVSYLTLYAFSTENWSRPRAEIDALFVTAQRYLRLHVIPQLKKREDIAVRFLGDLSALPESLADLCKRAEKIRESAPFTCFVALNYGGRDEILAAVNRAVRDGCYPLDHECVRRYLYTSGMPDPDLLIRTGGEMRLSNFLLYQCAYTELYFTDTLWPDFGREDILRAMDAYTHRKRRYGGLNKDDAL